MALYPKKTEKFWIWIAYDRKGRKPVDFECGDRDDWTGKKLIDRVAEIDCGKYCSDAWSTYSKFLPEEKHIISKAETHCLESFNATVRHYLARFHRRTHCYSKSADMVKLSLLLFFFKDLALSIFD